MGLLDSISGTLSTLFAPAHGGISPSPVLVVSPAPEPAPPVIQTAYVAPANLTAVPNGDYQMYAFLRTIYTCEGTDGPDGYRMLFGGTLFDSFADHPHRYIPFTNEHGAVQYSSAAGAPQILWPTWCELRTALQLPDFSPSSQDACAIGLIGRAGAVDDVRAGRLHVAVSKCSGIWASLPGGAYPQPARSWDFVEHAFTSNAGWIAY